MNRLALLLATLLALPMTARAGECEDAPPPSSATRAVSDAPYQDDAPPCAKPPAPSPKLREPEGWTAERDERTFQRSGYFLVSLGTLALVTGLEFAICARHSPEGGARDFCQSARAPTLITGGVLAGMGLGSLAISTWVLPSPAPSGRTAWSGGLQAGWAFELAPRH